MEARLLLEADHIKVSFGIRTVLDIPSLKLYDGDRIGLVGENGAGKSTLLSVISGERTPDEGRVAIKCGVSHIAQMGDTDLHDGEMDSALMGVFTVQEKREGLSGGEYTRRRIAGALTRGAHILLADEPTVDLDEEGINQLRERLTKYDGAVVLVSHDRTLLDEVCTRILELEDGKIMDYPGNYSAYRAEKERRLQFARDEYDAYRAEEKRLRKLIQDEYEHAQKKQHLPSRMGNSEARLHKREVTNVQAQIHKVRRGYESRLNRLEEKKRPREEVSIRMAFGASDGITSRLAVNASGVTVRFASRTVLNQARFVIPTGTKTAVIGKNGAGKTTLLRRIIDGCSGIKVSPGVKIGYFGQAHQEVLDESKTALENVRAISRFDESVCRTILARMNIRGDDVFKRVKVMSGGERAKIALARLMVSDANMLILDEPTNHMDIFSLEALEEMLLEYAGTLVFVSHDRRFVRNVANRLMFIENGQVRSFDGSFNDYEESLKRADRNKEEEERLLRIASIEMKLALLSARLSAPKKGDDPMKLNEEYLKLAEMLKKEKQAIQ